MAARSVSYVDRKIGHLTREIAAIEDHFYNSSLRDRDRTLHAGMLERRRDDVVRAAVLQLHTAIEDVINQIFECKILDATPYTRKKKGRTRRGKALTKILDGRDSIGFHAKLHLAAALGILRPREVKDLLDLNSLRNKCSHNWLLSLPVRRGRRPGQLKHSPLAFRGGNLHQLKTFKELTGTFGPLYYRLFQRHLDFGDGRWPI